MQAAFVRKGAFAHIGHVVDGRHIGHFEHKTRQFGDGFEFFHPDGIKAHLKGQIRNNRAQVGVAGAFSEAVDGTLNMPGAGPDCRQRIRYGTIRIIMAMNADFHARQRLDHSGGDFIDFMGQFAAVGFTQN